VFVRSRDLGEALAALIERDLEPVNSWRVEMDSALGLRWVNADEAVSRQPARSWWQRVEDAVFMAFPKEYY
jgi:putative cardiolipin synthase